nr:immunoglobulin heavy chain junction region [Mus musculus]
CARSRYPWYFDVW